MTMLGDQLDDFAEEKPEEEIPVPARLAHRVPRKSRKTKHVGAFDTGQPVPGEEPPPPSGAPHVYTAISAISAQLAQTGIGKTHQNPQQHYAFRGIDDIYNTLAVPLARHKLVILPQVEDRSVIERQTRGGAAIYYVTVKMSFDLISAVDGSRERVSSFGEAMDSGDKATNKALSTAYKYMAMQVFCIPTIGVDPEEDTYENVSGSPNDQQQPLTVDNSQQPLDTQEKHLAELLDILSKYSNRQEAEAWFLALPEEDKKLLRDRRKQREARH